MGEAGMSKVYLKCVRVSGGEWESDRDGCGVVISLDGNNVGIVRVGDVVVVENPELKNLFAQLSPEQKQVVLDYDGPEDFGHTEWQNKR